MPASFTSSCYHLTLQLKVCMAGSSQQYEATSCSVSARHPPTAQSHSLLRPQSQVHHCLFNLTTKFCQSHHPAVNSEGHLQPSFLKGSGDKQCVQQRRPPPLSTPPTGQSEACSLEAAPGEGRGRAPEAWCGHTAHFCFRSLPSTLLTEELSFPLPSLSCYT